MKSIAIRDIVVDPIIQIRERNHEPTIERYMECFDELPPVDVFDTSEGLLLADGFHRIVAATRLGLIEIRAEVHEGNRRGAVEFAITANTRHGQPLKAEERNEGIRRLREMHPGWPAIQIARAMSMPERTVKDMIGADDVALTCGKSGPALLPQRVTRVIAQSPREHWSKLYDAAANRKWSGELTRLAVKNLKDDRLPQKHKDALLAGEADPVVVTDSGELAMPAEVVARKVKEAQNTDLLLAIEKSLVELQRLRLLGLGDVKTIPRQRLDRLAKELPGYIELLQELSDAVKKVNSKLEVVK